MIRVLFEDECLVFVDKPAGIVVQRRLHAPDEPFLLDLVERQVGPVSLLQRLDRGTSGVIFFSKRVELNARLTRQFERKRIRKRYLALVEGALGEARAIDLPIARVGAIQFGVREGGKRAITHVEPIEARPTGSLVALRLETGRTHQIRVHLSAIGHPLAGDWLYGERNATRPMLHAAELELTHPLTQQPLCVTAPVPPDFRAEALRRELGAVALFDEMSPAPTSGA